MKDPMGVQRNTGMNAERYHSLLQLGDSSKVTAAIINQVSKEYDQINSHMMMRSASTGDHSR